MQSPEQSHCYLKSSKEPVGGENDQALADTSLLATFGLNIIDHRVPGSPNSAGGAELIGFNPGECVITVVSEAL